MSLPLICYWVFTAVNPVALLAGFAVLPFFLVIRRIWFSWLRVLETAVGQDLCCLYFFKEAYTFCIYILYITL